MQENAQYILIADYVPIANKGEEAIVRGIEDMLRDEDRPIEIGLFGPVERVTRHENITIFPYQLVYRVSGKIWWSQWRRIVGNVLISAQMRLGYYSRMCNLIPNRNPLYKELHGFFNKAEIIVVGHDGLFCTESCGVLHLARKTGKNAGILGSGNGITWKGRIYQGWLYRRTMAESSFCIFRDCVSSESVKRVSRNPEKIILAPDPAFYMKPASFDESEKVLSRYDSINDARKVGRCIVAATVLETGIVYEGFMSHLSKESKIKPHAQYLALIFDTLVREKNVLVVFLPHSIEKNANDVVAAKHVIDAMTAERENIVIIDEDLNPRVLKGIIRECDFLVGERVHSVIAGVSVGTPFVALTNRMDYRVHGIIGEMCCCEDTIINMDEMSSQGAAIRTLQIYDKREGLRSTLKETSRRINEQLEKVITIVKGGIL